MVWLLAGAGVWVALALPAAVLIGRAIRLADQRRTTEAGPEDSRVQNPAPRGSVARPRPPVVRDPMRGAEHKPSARDADRA